MPDNLDKIDEFFECRKSGQYAGGYAWFCKSCDKECNVGEVEYLCQDGRILPKYVICRYGCGSSWHLSIIPDACEPARKH